MANSGSVLFAIPAANVVSVEQGVVSNLAHGLLSICSVEAGGDHLVILSVAGEDSNSSFSYPLVKQPILKSDNRLYILPCSVASGQAQKNFVLSLQGEGGASNYDVEELEMYLAKYGTLRSRDSLPLGHASRNESAGTSAAVSSSSAAASAGAVSHPSSASTAIVPVVAASGAITASAAAPTVMGSLWNIGGKIAHEVTNPESVFRTKYVAPAASAASSAAQIVAHEITDPNSKLRTEIIPVATEKAKVAVNIISNEVNNKESVLRSQLLPAANAEIGKTVAAVKHEIFDADSKLNSEIKPAVTKELANPTVSGIGSGIATGVSMAGKGLATGLVSTADYAGRGVAFVADVTSKAVGPATEHMEISEATKTNIERSRSLTKAGVVVTGVMVVGAAAMAKSLGAAVSAGFLATDTGKKIATLTTTTETGRAVSSIAAATVGAAYDVWGGLEQAAYTFGTQTKNATTKAVAHNYGEEAAKAADSAMSLAGDVGQLTINLTKINPVNLAGSVAGSATLDYHAKTTGAEAATQPPQDMAAALASATNAGAAAVAQNPNALLAAASASALASGRL
jgi:hypothetical protein